MKSRFLLAALTTLLVAVPASSAAQTTAEVTLKVPVILTQLSPDIKWVRVSCTIVSDALIIGNVTYPNLVRKDEDIAVSGGEVVKLVTMVFSLTLNNPVGKSAQAGCTLQGASGVDWLNFNENATNPAFRTKPSVSASQSVFVW